MSFGQIARSSREGSGKNRESLSLALSFVCWHHIRSHVYLPARVCPCVSRSLAHLHSRSFLYSSSCWLVIIRNRFWLSVVYAMADSKDSSNQAGVATENDSGVATIETLIDPPVPAAATAAVAASSSVPSATTTTQPITELDDDHDDRSSGDKALSTASSSSASSLSYVAPKAPTPPTTLSH